MTKNNSQALAVVPVAAPEALANYDRACVAIANAHRVDEAKDIADKARR
jgi:hypothetical protein